MFRNSLRRERPFAARAHGDMGEELRLSIIRLGPDTPEMIELRQWNFKPDQSFGPSSHGLRFPCDMAGWLGRELLKLENESGDVPEN